MAFELIVIGASRGGLHALQRVLADLPGEFPLSVVIVQHRERGSDETLSTLLQQRSTLPVSEMEDKETIQRGHVYLAPSDYHLLIEDGHFALSIDAPVQCARPSIDVLFASAAEAYRERVVGVLLTGASADGAQGLAAIKQHGGLTVVQDPATAEARAMPEAALAAAAVDRILPLGAIGSFLADLSRTRRKQG